MEIKDNKLKEFTLEQFKKAMEIESVDILSTTNEEYSFMRARQHLVYTTEEALQIVQNGEPEVLRDLSMSFRYSSGYYKRLLAYYAAILDYSYLLIPHMVKRKKKITDKRYQELYEKAVEMPQLLHFKNQCVQFATEVLACGSYYGYLRSSEEGYVFQQLPFKYCRSLTKTTSGIDTVDLNMEWIDKITDNAKREATIDIFPKDFRHRYKQYSSGSGKKNSKWYRLPVGYGIHFSLEEERPYFVSVIPAIINMTEYILLEKEKDEQKLKTILAQQVPIYQGELVFDPEEAKVMHKGSCQMMKNLENVKVLTTYADVKKIPLQEDEAAVKNVLEKIENIIYTESGTSKQLFAADNSTAMTKSIENDISFMMGLATQFGTWLESIINLECADKNISFTTIMLPVSVYNKKEYMSLAMSAAQSGYSFLLPAAILGIDQEQLVDIKEVENKLLNLPEVLMPLQSSYTQSGSATILEKEAAQKEGPSKDVVTEKTEQNKQSNGQEE